MEGIAAATTRLKAHQSLAYPDKPIYTGPEAPCRFEAEVYNCEVRGTIPDAIDGTYYRNMPDPQWAPKCPDDIYFNGDGCIDALRFHNGHVDFKQKHVRTRKFVLERAARGPLFGKFRNPWSDDPRVKDEVRSTANTHIVYYNKMLLALKEDSPAYALDPNTLDTIGLYDFDGQNTSPTSSAHPKIDPVTGEYITIGYEARGDGSPTIAYHVFDKNGKKTEECWFDAPFAGMTHDMGVTENWVVIIIAPLVCVSAEKQKEGYQHFAWDENTPVTFGLLPRRSPKPEDVKWFIYKSVYIVHCGNSFEEDGCVYIDTPVAYGNRMFFFPPLNDKSGKQRAVYKAHYARWRFDPNATDSYVEPQPLIEFSGEFPTVDNRYLTRKYRYAFLTATLEKSQEAGSTPLGSMGGLQNGIAMCDTHTGKISSWTAGPDTAMCEATFCPRSPDAAEADGYLISALNCRDKGLTCIVILDTRKIHEGPIAIISLPFRLRTGTHGSWVPAQELGERRELCDMQHVTEEMQQKFGQDHKVKLNNGNSVPSVNGSGVNGLASVGLI
ncbi:related to lignostilbene dioxygenase [Phialocephala subalpina]|uniref:Related to lignostilbene dioxygenase n=1 Tax=Phialocephala subalpina TaxID=576137 RepID=A0A1L7X5G2_9HELO|nr:related to lignostilbene dioxygenase [Phialocephala subalpina]